MGNRLEKLPFFVTTHILYFILRNIDSGFHHLTRLHSMPEVFFVSKEKC